jgi:hypothetical protein
MKKSGPDWGPLFLSERQRLANADADGRTATPAFVDDDIIAMMMTLLHDHHAIGAMIPPAIVMAVVLLDDDSLRVRGVARDRQGDADGGESSNSQNELTHANFSSGVDIASTPKARTRSIFCSEPPFMERPDRGKVAAGIDSLQDNLSGC